MPRRRQRTTDRDRRKPVLRTRRATGVRAGRVVRVVGVERGKAWSTCAPRFTARQMAQWCRRMERADRTLRATTVIWAPRDGASPDCAFAEVSAKLASGPPVHMVSAHLHGFVCPRTRRAMAYFRKTPHCVAQIVEQLYRRFQPRKIVLFVCSSAVNYTFNPSVRCPVWAPQDVMIYSADHEAWEQRGCPTRDKTEWFPNSVVAQTMHRVQ